jgi:hypothetical protein
MPNSVPFITYVLAERHEALWLSLSHLHKDLINLGAKRPTAATSEAVRITVEGLLADCAPFIRKRRDRLPVAAPDLAGIGVQLGQALSALEAFESQHTQWDERYACRTWRVERGVLPVKRHKPPSMAMVVPPKDISDMRNRLARRMAGRDSRIFEEGFAAGKKARQGTPETTPEPEEPQSYPRVRQLD